jgi:hypothetical protein
MPSYGAGFGVESIHNFSTVNDILELSSAQVADAATALHDAAQVGADTVITIDAHDVIDLAGVTASHLSLHNFDIIA